MLGIHKGGQMYLFYMYELNPRLYYSFFSEYLLCKVICIYSDIAISAPYILGQDYSGCFELQRNLEAQCVKYSPIIV